MNEKQKSKNIVAVVGVPGSGKSLILSAVERLGDSIEVQNYGKAMLAAAGRAEIDRDRMRYLSTDEQVALGISAAELVLERAIDSTSSTIIVDTHALVKSPLGYVPGLPLSILQVLKPKVICVVEAAPEFVCRCRESDQQRFREQVSIREIERHQELTRQFAVSCTMISGSVLHFIENDGQAPEEMAKPLVQLIQQLK